jgi:hypothetical protein
MLRLNRGSARTHSNTRHQSSPICAVLAFRDQNREECILYITLVRNQVKTFSGPFRTRNASRFRQLEKTSKEHTGKAWGRMKRDFSWTV